MQAMQRRHAHAVSSAQRESMHFLKIILPSPIHTNQMRIPEEFIKRFGDELSTSATITVPDGRVWKMRLKKCGKDVLFCSKWREFVKYYSLSYGSHLVFRYEGNSKFRVLIFDVTCAEICYPRKTRGTNGEPNLDSRKKSVGDDQHHSYERRKKKLEDENVDEDSVNLKGDCKARKKEKESCSYGKGKQVKSDAATYRFKTENPYVTCTIKRDRLYVGRGFSKKYLKPNVCVMLQNSNGEQWDVHCRCHNWQYGGVVMIKGWSKFVRENHLSEGDLCVLELIKRDPIVLKFTLLGATA
ncbi:hypothetical protein VNO78_13025 [Psophocarpus tetragonolobus]|uniref:TF-B3 domain-containing protein n=1 Tax=Psophocarpus tetragonolobus TaxID=3891 RepID=A0AAN9SNR8_PSOTE